MSNNSSKLNTKKKILVADDDPSILEAIQLILEDAGYEVITAVDGEAIYKMEKDYPDLLLLDIWMSGQDGREICKFLKNRDTTKDIPIVMISANKDTEEIAKEAGADDFITKPFEMNDLLKKVSKFMDFAA
jgi:CheY-like chemotaxis protein